MDVSGDNTHWVGWGWPAIVALAGAVLGYAHKGGKGIRTMILSILTSMFVAFIIYGLASLWVSEG
jgi:uncharacterized membrane protein